MAQKPSQAPLIVAVGIALVLLLGANMMAQNANPEIQEKLAKEREEKAASNQANNQQQAPASGAGSELVGLGDKANVGKKGGTTKVVIGYEWTAAVQGNPGTVYEAVSQIKKMAPDASIEVVNVDANPDVPQGISINGNMVMPTNPDGTLDANGEKIGRIMQMMRRPPDP